MHQVELYLASLESSESEEGANVFSFEFNYSSNHKYFTDSDVLGTFLEKRDEAESYEKTIRTYIAQAETNKSRFSIIGNRQSYSYRYQDAIIERYESLLEEVDVQFDYIYGWDTFFSYNGDIVLSFLAVCLLAGVSVPDEQTSDGDEKGSAENSGCENRRGAASVRFCDISAPRGELSHNRYAPRLFGYPQSRAADR